MVSEATLLRRDVSSPCPLFPYHVLRGWRYDLGRADTSTAVYASEMTVDLIAKGNADGWPKTVVPAERAGDAEDISGAVLYLASKAGAYVNGNVLVTDGGRLGVLPSSY